MEEYQVARLLTGTRSAQEIVAELRNRGSIEWKIAEVAELIGCFVSSGLASLPQGQQEDLMTSLTMSEVEQQRFSAWHLPPVACPSESTDAGSLFFDGDAPVGTRSTRRTASGV